VSEKKQKQFSIIPDTASRSTKKPADTSEKNEKLNITAASDTLLTVPPSSKSIFLVDGKNAMEGSIPKKDNADGISFTNRMRKADKNKPDLRE
jgi:hypothetical protein